MELRFRAGRTRYSSWRIVVVGVGVGVLARFCFVDTRVLGTSRDQRSCTGRVWSNA